MTHGDTAENLPTDERLQAILALATGRTIHPYPWPELERELDRDARDDLWLIGYGSLMNRQSAARTIHESGQRTPVIAFGVRRLFNCFLSPANEGPYGPVAAGRERAVLNVYPTGNPADVMNGVLCKVPRADLPALRARERGYDLIAVGCVSFGDPAGEPFVGRMLAAPDPQTGQEAFVDDSLLPHGEYMRVCRAGARSVSAAFEKMFLTTTYLGDRRTTLADCAQRS